MGIDKKYKLREYKLNYKGKLISTNSAKSLHWRALRSKVLKLEVEFLSIILKSNLPKFNKFEVDVQYWNRFDCDNVVFSVKVMIDQLNRQGKFIDDDKRYWKKLTITANEELENNTIIFKIIEIK